MTDTDRAAARARGQAIRGVRIARARSIRRRIVAGALALFVAAWLMIAIVLVSGHDPALANRSSAATVASSSSSPTVTTSSSASNSSGGSSSTQSSPSGTSSGSTGNSSSGASSVTTSQS